MLAVEILLAEPETLGDVLESCLDLLRERPRALGDVRSPEYLGYGESIAPQP